MELVDGQDLASWQSAHAPSWREIVAVYVQAARGLAAAHRAGLVHRDFKPSNALLGKDGVVRVTDFGLARSASKEVGGEPANADAGTASGEVGLTRTGAVVGTPAYMAPEQHLGAAIDARTDQWALACSLYEALYRRRPFADDDLAQLRQAVVSGALRAEPAQPAVPRAIRLAIRRALAVQPEDRFPAMDTLIAALEPPRRARWIAGGLAASAVIVVAAVAARRAPTCAGLDVPLAAAWNAARAEALRARFVAAGLGPVAARVIPALDEYGARWVATRTQACVQARQGVQSPELLDRRMRCLDHRLVELGTVIGGLSAADPTGLRRAGAAIEQLHPTADCDAPVESVPLPASAQARKEIEAAEADLARGSALFGLNQNDRALPLAERAASIGERIGWTPLSARALVLRGKCEDRQRRYEVALGSFERAASLAAQAKDDEQLVEALANRFLVVGEHLGRMSEALAERRFIELALERAGQPSHLRAKWLHFLAILLYQQDHAVEALSAEREAVGILQRILPAGHSELLDSLETEGNIEITRGEFAHAAELHNQVLAGRIAAGGPEHPLVIDSLVNLAWLESSRGNLRQALSYLERGRTVERAAGITHRQLESNIGEVRFELGQWRAAAADLTAAMAMTERETPGDSKYVGDVALTLGASWFELGELARAERLFERAATAWLVAGDPQAVTAYAYLARVALARGDLAAARARLGRVDQLVSHDAQRALAHAELTRAEAGCNKAHAAYERALEAATKQFAQSVKSDAVVGLAECELELGAPAKALALLEPQLHWLDEAHADASARGRAHALSARALRAR
jgi:tetratricopeptide (TPR) repeat protein